MKELIEFYQDFSAEFEEELRQRTPEETAYDMVILQELYDGESIETALEVAGEVYPDEALGYTDDQLEDLEAHYEFLLNHEIIKGKIARLTN